MTWCGDKEEILKNISQERIFEHVFGFYPEIKKKVKSPFREDKKAGCFFKWYKNTLYFIDFADSNTHIDCFKAIKLYYNVNTWKEVLSHLEGFCEAPVKPLKTNIKFQRKQETRFRLEKREFTIRDQNFWSRYGISKENLIEDSVFAVKKYQIIKDGSNIVFNYMDDNRRKSFGTYCIYKKGEKVKLYSPYETKFRFIGTCKSDDVGGTEIQSDTLVISKSYKDYRVLKNAGCNVIWFQSECMFPSVAKLTELLWKYTHVIIFFDNDETGIRKSKELEDFLSSFLAIHIRRVYLPFSLLDEGVKDPSDLYSKKGIEEFNKILKQEFKL